MRRQAAHSAKNLGADCLQGKILRVAQDDRWPRLSEQYWGQEPIFGVRGVIPGYGMWVERPHAALENRFLPPRLRHMSGRPNDRET